jgi:phosphatidylserine/phosphatidylglycerophosphate/cardiolipin synthase-like enzyme
VRQSAEQSGLTIQVVAGTYVVLIGMSVGAAQARGLLGFAIERTDHTEGERRFLSNSLVFQRNSGAVGEARSSLLNPVQAVVWGDYTAKPRHTYTYAVTAMYGTPDRLEPGATARARVRTEDPDDGVNGVFFNRGVAASAAYERRFGAKAPGEVPNREAYAWLSRGLEEAVIRFIGQAVDERFELYAAMYEFKFPTVLQAFRIAAESGARVRIVYDRVSGDGPGEQNAKAIRAAGIEQLVTPRTHTKIAHNKFIVLVRDGRPEQVWTGSTNISRGGIFGHANVGHRVSDPDVAAGYLAYWRAVSGDPEREPLRAFDDPTPQIPAGRPRARRTAIFSPRSTLDSLEWYVRLADSARQAVFLTAAFGLTREIAPVFEGDRDYLRYLLLDKDRGNVEAMRGDPDNVVTAGEFAGRGGFKAWIAEALDQLNLHVHYVHTKLMLVDPLSSDPIVVTGSANWSDESSKYNDENMLVIRGDTRTADIYLTDFMRIFNHYRLRARAGLPPEEAEPGPGHEAATPLAPDDSWAAPYWVPGSPAAKERLLFSGAAA